MLNLQKKKHKKDFDGEFDITPMIDVVMLLLIFFMVSARMSPQIIAQLPRAKHGETSSFHDSVVLCVKAGGSGTAIVLTPGGKVFDSDADAQSAELADYVQEQMAEQGKSSVLIQGEPRVTSAEISRIRKAVSSVMEPDQDILLAVEH